MRKVIREQMILGEEDIAKIIFDPKSRDDIPQLLTGLQHIWTNLELRKVVFNILEEIIPCRVGYGKEIKASKNKGRPGMEQWKILVLGVLRLGLNTNFARIHELANQHMDLRKMLGHGMQDNNKTYNEQTIIDNVSLFTPELLSRISVEVVKAGHVLVKKKDDALSGRCDSFVVKTDVHFPTDISLLFDSVRKMIEECVDLCDCHEITDWRQSQYNISSFKKLYRKAQVQKHSTSEDEEKRAAQEVRVKQAYQDYLDQAEIFLAKARATRILLAVR